MLNDYTELRSKIRRNGYTQEEFAKALGITNTTLSEKLNNKSEFKQNEMFKTKELLKISNRDMLRLFFTEIT